MPKHVEVELDIFSGMPNPAWLLTDTEADNFTKQLAALPQTSAHELSGNLGYRGFIVQVAEGADRQSIHIQTGTIRISKGEANAYSRDQHRRLERWLLNTGRPHMKDEIFQIVEREFR